MTTTEFKGVPDPWAVTCDHVAAIGEAWQPIEDSLNELPRSSTNGLFLQQKLPDESGRLTETMVRASVEGAALAAEGDSWAEVLRLYADYVLRWFPDLVGDVKRRIGPNDLSDDLSDFHYFHYDIARYTLLEERCSALGRDVPGGNDS
jgi:hypothetical protein